MIVSCREKNIRDRRTGEHHEKCRIRICLWNCLLGAFSPAVHAGEGIAPVTAIAEHVGDDKWVVRMDAPQPGRWSLDLGIKFKSQPEVRKNQVENPTTQSFDSMPENGMTTEQLLECFRELAKKST